MLLERCRAAGFATWAAVKFQRTLTSRRVCRLPLKDSLLPKINRAINRHAAQFIQYSGDA